MHVDQARQIIWFLQNWRLTLRNFVKQKSQWWIDKILQKKTGYAVHLACRGQGGTRVQEICVDALHKTQTQRNSQMLIWVILLSNICCFLFKIMLWVCCVCERFVVVVVVGKCILTYIMQVCFTSITSSCFRHWKKCTHINISSFWNWQQLFFPVRWILCLT